ncbi:MAG: cell division protein ZapB [Deltaproteobacteria bacterium]|nr:cell division protein ZapB [Deltaproteobacteria bacterium]
MSLENLKLLEAKVEEFVEQHERIRREHEELTQRLKEREAQLAAATAQVKQFEQERGEIRARLERLMGRLGTLDLS